MRTQFIPKEQDYQYDTFAENIGAAVVVEVEGGYKGFESVDCHKT